jgi:AraC family transcriptional regulator of adaptative response/methylated-DNA-[protein]-cysteine methyltransferase
MIEESETIPSLEDLARRLGKSAHHFHRVFKQITGLTPRQYAAAQREKKLRHQLVLGSTVTGAIFDAGYSSSSRFYERSNKVLGMLPSCYRAGGIDAKICFAVGECSLGSILVAQSQRGICAILLGSDPDKLVHELQDSFPNAVLNGGDSGFEELVATVVGFIEAPRIGLSLPLDIRGTAFQQRVWQALRAIPPGKTKSYTDVAQYIGASGSARAVAGACAANKLAVAIPCHRVVRNDGGLAGYRWGVERKRALIENESRATPEKGEVFPD